MTTSFPTRRSSDLHVVNASVLRDQLAELDRDRRNGTLSEQDHEETVQDLQRRALEEAKPPTTIVSRRPSGKNAALGLAIVLPLASTLIYRSEEHTSELQSLMRISYAVFCLK